MYYNRALLGGHVGRKVVAQGWADNQVAGKKVATNISTYPVGRSSFISYLIILWKVAVAIASIRYYLHLGARLRCLVSESQYEPEDNLQSGELRRDT